MATVFLDRDGVINKDVGYISKWDDFSFLPGSLEALKLLSEKNVKIIIVTNQSGIARGYFSEPDYLLLERKINEYLKGLNIYIRASYYCPHYLGGIVKKYSINCNCRKPAPGMLLQASKDFNIIFSNAIMIGDKKSDMEAALSVGIPDRYLIDENMQPNKDGYKHSTRRFKSLLDSVNYILQKL